MTRRPTQPVSVADRFRDEITKAEAGGSALEALTLNLTFGDASQLQRDRTVPLADISFVGGQMRYLGVKVVRGGERSLLSPD
jgi:hypothetical protein